MLQLQIAFERCLKVFRIQFTLLLNSLETAKIPGLQWEYAKGEGGILFKRTILTILALLGSMVALSLLILGNAGLSANKEEETEPVWNDDRNEDVIIDAKEPLSFPCYVEGTDLLIEQVICYDGPFWEDGSNREMKGITAILLRNTGSVGILDVNITLNSDKDHYGFRGEDIPANSSVLILEADAKQFSQKQYYKCSGNAIIGDIDWLQDENIRLEMIGMDALSITNTTDRILQDLQIVYKSIYTEGEFYLGGLSHTVVLASLSAGETVIVKPRYFADPYSRVLRVSFRE